MFATGIRIDEMDKCVEELGVELLRYGRPIHTTPTNKD